MGAFDNAATTATIETLKLTKKIQSTQELLLHEASETNRLLRELINLTWQQGQAPPTR